MADAAKKREVLFYQDENGKEPFTDWLESLRDIQARRRILKRLRLVEQGHFGDCKAVGGGVTELRFFFGSSYRVYLAEAAGDIVLLLTGGDKASQTKDIKRAKAYWRAYKND
ncbi:MAG: type II toxin-antitoxin system RelE/ParE family toxin [Robiginitomaculum sp.]|nr:type II toxin-antitoxin system RelE/ParE family toxin [Robiginitomaculum sp.]